MTVLGFPFRLPMTAEEFEHLPPVEGVRFELSEGRLEVPDVTRFRRGVAPRMDRSQFPAGDVDLVVEIVSAESERRDRDIKPDEYAAARIPEFWLVESDPTTTGMRSSASSRSRPVTPTR